jgi:hypothetical protein
MFRIILAILRETIYTSWEGTVAEDGQGWPKYVGKILIIFIVFYVLHCTVVVLL